MSDLIERLRAMRKRELEAATRDQYTAAGEAFIRSADEVIETIRALTAEMDFLRAKIDSAPTTLPLQDQVTASSEWYAIHSSPLERLPPDWIGKRVALVVLDGNRSK